MNRLIDITLALLALLMIIAVLHAAHVLGATPPIPQTVAVVDDTSSVMLAWDASSSAGVESYRVHWGTNVGQYIWSTNVGNALQATVGNLVAGGTYHFTVTALGTNQLESPQSNPVSYTVAVVPAAPTLRLPQMLQVEVVYEGRTVDGSWRVLGRETVNIKTEESFGLFRARVDARQVDMIQW